MAYKRLASDYINNMWAFNINPIQDGHFQGWSGMEGGQKGPPP